jgi:hypothetical protein
MATDGSSSQVDITRFIASVLLAHRDLQALRAQLHDAQRDPAAVFAPVV